MTTGLNLIRTHSSVHSTNAFGLQQHYWPKYSKNYNDLYTSVLCNVKVCSVGLPAVSLHHESNFVNTSNTTPGEMLVITITALIILRRAIVKWLFKNKSIFATKE